ncbi:prolyl oligopeptidase family serine peptidase [Actinokineospora sp. UTMC 2448]|uniref:S9 family peptidase n=1 Tax=Actinokineospora sp. UTMC 2448 TaxID=2268449 RepID=UPI0021649205|nr:prolyl oligopeptidase family serine peptidase [Actinokineospora sp. UTMC 2448]UVS79390.1 Prolyl tripeptidyl peptidase precursor [Actinokineospora sp. UTMC 2448]
MVHIAPHGGWESPLTAADVARSAAAPTWVLPHGGAVWWTRSLPEEGGRQALLRSGPDGPVEVLGAPWSARDRVHEYGGRPFTVVDGRVVFTEWGDQRVYAVTDDGPVPLTGVPDREHGWRYSDLTPGPGGEVWCVRETVTGDAPTDVVRDLVAVSLSGGVRVLGRSHHFMTAPQPSPDGRHAAWIGWSHPDMPWDASELCVAAVGADGVFGPHRVVAGGPGVSVCQVCWEAPDSLLAMADPRGWWNLHRIGLDGAMVALAPGDHELGGPLWQLGRRWFAPLGRGRHAVLRAGALAVLDERSGTVTDVDTDFAVFAPDLHAADGVVTTCAAGPRTPWTVISLDLSTGVHTEHTRPDAPDPRYLPEPVARTVDADGHAVPVLVYPPTNPDFAGPEGESPPYLLYPHSGPTTAFSRALDLDIAFFTSRGFGVVAVDYAGSTGHGRAFRELLHGRWGVVDVADTIAAAAALVADGTADPTRLAVRGGSAGGFTAAAAMTGGAVFACATLMFPLLDLSPWAEGRVETHDFESRYVERLVGALPEHADRYRERSPVGAADRVRGPVLVLQGAEDPVCPPEQVKRFVDGLRVPHAYLSFDGERHGFRRAETIAAAYAAELSFYGRVFGFTPPGVPELELTP